MLFSTLRRFFINLPNKVDANIQIRLLLLDSFEIKGVYLKGLPLAQAASLLRQYSTHLAK